MTRSIKHQSARSILGAFAGIALFAAGIGMAAAQPAPATAPTTPPAPMAQPGAVPGTPPAPTVGAPDVGAPAAATTDAAAPADGTTTENGVDKVKTDNPYGLGALWAQGDFVAKGTLIILVIMSMGTWYILFTKYAEQAAVLKQAKTAENQFWKAGSLNEGLNKLENRSAFRMIVENGMRAAQHHEGRLTDQIDLNDWVAMSLTRSTAEITTRLQGGLAFLATVGSTAPFVGLFGTVWGIYHALIAIGVSGQASIDKVAGPVGEALIMTAIGLAVAVPAVLAYNFLIARNKSAIARINAFTGDLQGFLIGGKVARSK
jgi:biopolymer transport protein ExbB